MAIVDDTFGFGGPIKPTDSVQQVRPRRSADRRRPDEEDVEFDPVDQERPDEDEDRPLVTTKSTNGRDPDVDILSEPRIGPRDRSEDGSLTQEEADKAAADVFSEERIEARARRKRERLERAREQAGTAFDGTDVDQEIEDYKEDQRQSGQQQEEAQERPNAPSEQAPATPAPETPASTQDHRPGFFKKAAQSLGSQAKAATAPPAPETAAPDPGADLGADSGPVLDSVPELDKEVSLGGSGPGDALAPILDEPFEAESETGGSESPRSAMSSSAGDAESSVAGDVAAPEAQPANRAGAYSQQVEDHMASGGDESLVNEEFLSMARRAEGGYHQSSNQAYMQEYLNGNMSLAQLQTRLNPNPPKEGVGLAS